MTVPLCYYGSPDPLPERRALRAGPLTAIYEAGDLRYVKVGGVEVCRRWYAAIRDRNWGTVPGVISDEVIEQSADGFRVTYTSTHKQGDIHFIWRAEIVGKSTEWATSYGRHPGAEITFRFDGEAITSFLRNRIGFCVLHPPCCAGLPVSIHHPDGNITTGLAFPDLIAPTNPFHEVRTIQPDSSHQAWWEFEGDVFETEDQRNWIDASFKTFCTPLRLPFPVEVQAGERVSQAVSMSTIGIGVEEDAPLSLTRVDGPTTRMPMIGVCRATNGTLDDHERDRLRLLRPAHLRAEIDLTETDRWVHRLADAWQEALALDAPLELAVTMSDNACEETADLIGALHQFRPPLARVLAFHNREWATPERIIRPVVEAIARYDATVPVYVGTTANFTELNRGRPPLEGVEGVCYSVQPQEHAFDNASLVECCAIIADTVRSARAFCGDKPIAVTPITLRKRVNPYATGPALPVPRDELPPTVDPRQMSLFGAAWTLGALKSLAESGVASATFYETTGWLGVMENSYGCRLPHLFPSRPGMVYPLFHVLTDATEWSQARVHRCQSSDPMRFDALMMASNDGRRCILLANMTNQPQTVVLPGMPPTVRLRTLDETTFDFATADPIAFRQTFETWPVSDYALTLSLNPYAYVRIDG